MKNNRCLLCNDNVYRTVVAIVAIVFAARNRQRGITRCIKHSNAVEKTCFHEEIKVSRVIEIRTTHLQSSMIYVGPTTPPTLWQRLQRCSRWCVLYEHQRLSARSTDNDLLASSHSTALTRANCVHFPCTC